MKNIVAAFLASSILVVSPAHADEPDFFAVCTAYHKMEAKISITPIFTVTRNAIFSWNFKQELYKSDRILTPSQYDEDDIYGQFVASIKK